MAEYKADVFICGAGPVGLVLAYHLNALGISTFIIDSADKSSPEFPMYGRACTLFPRTLELLDQLGLYDDLAQEALVSDKIFAYRDGERVHDRGWQMFQSLSGTFFNFYLNLRLKFSEDVFRERLAAMNTFVHAPLKLIEYVVDENTSGEHKVSAKCQSPTGELAMVHAKYIVGADGGSSAVRKLGEIPFVGESKNQHWVRIDGIARTNIPEARSGSGIMESEIYGPVLFVALDHGATRIGYVLTNEMFQKYGHDMTQEDAVYEAKLAVAPFELEFEQVDWHTVYKIQQRVADRFVDRERVILAGDAAHTHSSGAAQGMNTGMHDVVSLGWRLAGVLKGWFYQPVLQNYSDERRAIAQQLLANDRTISMLTSGEKPEELKNRPEHCTVLLREFLEQTAGFTNGLKISYPSNLLNDTTHSIASLYITPGGRAPDTVLRKPGLQKQGTVRLGELTRFNGKFQVLIFTGRPMQTSRSLKTLRAQVDQHMQPFAHAVDFLTIIEGNGKAFDEHLGLRKFGKAYWDTDSSAHDQYGAEANVGAIAVLRPDGIVGLSAPLDGFASLIVPYFQKLIVPRNGAKFGVKERANLGELINPNENNLVFSRTAAEVGA